MVAGVRSDPRSSLAAALGVLVAALLALGCARARGANAAVARPRARLRAATARAAGALLGAHRGGHRRAREALRGSRRRAPRAQSGVRPGIESPNARATGAPRCQRAPRAGPARTRRASGSARVNSRPRAMRRIWRWGALRWRTRNSCCTSQRMSSRPEKAGSNSCSSSTSPSVVATACTSAIAPLPGCPCGAARPRRSHSTCRRTAACLSSCSTRTPAWRGRAQAARLQALQASRFRALPTTVRPREREALQALGYAGDD